MLATASPMNLTSIPAGVSSGMAPIRAPHNARRVRIVGITAEGRTFRPSDLAERLAGVMSPFRPDRGAGGTGVHVGYSPYCVPTVFEGLRCVIVTDALRELEVLAWDFVMGFARDNSLQVVEM